MDSPFRRNSHPSTSSWTDAADEVGAVAGDASDLVGAGVPGGAGDRVAAGGVSLPSSWSTVR